MSCEHLASLAYFDVVSFPSKPNNLCNHRKRPPWLIAIVGLLIATPLSSLVSSSIDAVYSIGK